MAAGLLALLLLATTACGNNNGNGIEKMPEQENSVMNIDINKFSWTREPQSCVIKGDTIEVVTKPKTDLWQRTYYHFQNDNAPVFQMETEEKYFSFIVKTDFTGSHHRFDQCGIALYLDSENWLKASVEYENEEFQHLGSVVTNNGYSDWATTAIDAKIKTMWYRLSRREDDYCIECSEDGAEAQSQSPCPLYGASVEHGDLYCGHQENCAFAMHSVMKFPQALYVADYLHKKGLTLNDSILVHKDSLDAATWSPMLSRFEGTRYFTFAELIEWSLKQSDNNACDLLFASCGKPEAVEKYIHSLGFKDIHVQLTEKDMKKSPHRAAENSSTPKEMTRLLEWFYRHRDDNKNLSFIWDTMADCNTGQQRIAAVLPKDGKLIHKTGSGFPSSDGRQDRNDVGIVLLPDGSHLSIAIFLPKSKDENEVAEVAEQCLMRIQADKFLRNMPAGLQHKQTLAITRAMDGDNKELMAVRNSRNAPPKYSDHVETRMITPAMRLYEPKGSQGQRLPALLYLHGGGWTFGSINSCGKFCDALAASGEMRVIALDYRLAPEHPYPEGLNDCTAAVNYIIAHAAELHIDASHITIGGDSSGGNLALATALSESCRGKIESLLLFYPVTMAFDDGSESWKKYGKGFGLDAEIMEAFNRAYTINADNRSPAISVGLCSDEELNMLPRTLLIAAERDILRDQGLNLSRRMGGKIRRIEYKGAVHLFITVPGQDRAFDRAVKDAIRFISNK